MFHDGFMGGGMWFTWIFWLVIVGLIVYLIFKYTGQNRGTSHRINSETALDILKKRYARGEISQEEFNEMKKDLDS
jgi:putative membrane protein